MTDQIQDTLGALGDETRRRVVESLARGPRSVGELAAELDITPAALTRHLRTLRRSALVVVALDPADNRRHLYQLTPEPLAGLRDWVDHLAAFWTDQLTSFADHANGEVRRTRESEPEHAGR